MLSFTSEDVLDEEIPECVPIPMSLHVDRGVNDFTVIFLNTETTGRNRWNESCQVAACTKDEENDSFQIYILPNKEISASATEVNYITKRNGKLFFTDGEVHAETLETAIKKFVSWLKKLSPCILVAHNGQFDVRVLKHAADKSKESIDSSTVL